MAFLVGGANSAVSGYDIDNSCRFNDGDSPSLTRATGTLDDGEKFQKISQFTKGWRLVQSWVSCIYILEHGRLVLKASKWFLG